VPQNEQPAVERTVARLGAVCVVLGSLAVLGFRIAHGDPPAADAPAALRFITDHPAYTGVHLGAILGVLVWAGGLVTVAGTFRHGLSRALGRLGATSVLVGAAIFVTDFAIDGVAGQDLAAAWAAAAPAARAELELAYQTAATMLRGTSLISIVILWGLSLLLFGRALMHEGYPAWLSWTGVAAGGATVVGATAQLFQPDLFPGALVYGLLVSLVQVWSVALGVVLWRRAGLVALGADG
jgi:hypothetical protein